MKTIGIIGGLSWVSTTEYYRIMNQEVSARLGGHHSAKIIMYSIDAAGIVAPTIHENWENIERIVVSAARTVEKAGADFVIICSNAIHKVAGAVQRRVRIPLLHIAHATARKIKDIGLDKVALLGARDTMEDNFYRQILSVTHGLDFVIPNAQEREIIDRVIFEELVFERIYPASKEKFISIINRLAREGVEGVVLGCTEIPLLVQQTDCPLPLFDTTAIHATAAVDYALEDMDAKEYTIDAMEKGYAKYKESA